MADKIKPREAVVVRNMLDAIERLSPAARGTLFGALFSTYCCGAVSDDDVAKCGLTIERCDEHRGDNFDTEGVADG